MNKHSPPIYSLLQKVFFLSLLFYNISNLSAQTFNQKYPTENDLIGRTVAQIENGFQIQTSNEITQSKVIFSVIETDKNGQLTTTNEVSIDNSLDEQVIKTLDNQFLFIKIATPNIVRLNKKEADGSLLWSKDFEFSDAAALIDGRITQNSAGEIFIAGQGWDSSKDKKGFYIIKASADGNKIWQKEPNFSSNSTLSTIRISHLTATDDGGLILVNSSNVNTSQNVVTAFRYDADGEEVTISSSSSFLFNTGIDALAFGPNQTTAVASYVRTNIRPRNKNSTLQLVNAVGEEIWASDINKALPTAPNAVAQNATVGAIHLIEDGGLVVTGYKEEIGDGLSPKVLFILKFDATGNVSWFNEYDFLAHATFITQTEDEGYLITGSRDNQIWLIKTDAEGKIAPCECIVTEPNPVCGSDGKTYADNCEAECIGISWTKGECSDTMPTITADCNSITAEGVFNDGSNDNPFQGIIIKGDNSPVKIIKIFDENWQVVKNCSGDCKLPFSFETSAGDYIVQVQLYEANWAWICQPDNIFINVPAGESCDAVFFKDGDGDGFGDENNTVSGCSAPTGFVNNSDDCDDTNPAIREKQTPGTACDDGDPTTNSEVIQADGCTCSQTTTSNNPDCNNVTVTSTPSGELRGIITISGLTAPIEIVKIFDENWSPIFECSADCQETEIFQETEIGKYYVQVQMYTEDWKWICQTENIAIFIEQNTSCAGNLLPDNDGDGVCEGEDCDDNDPEIGGKQLPETACDDNDPNTTDDKIQADGCTCKGSSGQADCSDVKVKYQVGLQDTYEGLGIEGLNAPIEIVKVYDADWNLVFVCNANCDNPMVLTNLRPGLYRVEVQMYTENWQSICTTDYLEVTIPSSKSRNSTAEKVDFYLEEKEIRVFPNPAQSKLLLYTKTLQGKKGSIQIFNTNGKKMDSIPSKIFKKQYESINVASYKNGLYYLIINVDNMPVISRKFIVERLN